MRRKEEGKHTSRREEGREMRKGNKERTEKENIDRKEVTEEGNGRKR